MANPRKDIMRFAAIFAGGTMLSRVTGLLRDMVFTRFIPGQALGTFLFAFSLPNMLRDMLGEGATNAAIIPVLSGVKEHEQESVYREAVAVLMGAMLVLFAVIGFLGVAIMPLVPSALSWLTPITGQKLPQSAEELHELVSILQWTFPYIILIGMSVFVTAPLFIARRYGTASWSPLLLNLALIASCVLLANRFENPTWSLIIGMWVGGVIQLVVLYIEMYRYTGIVRPRFNLRHPAVRQVFWLLLAVIIGQATGEVNKLVDRFFAMSLGEDKVTALYISNRLVQLPLSVFGIAISVAILPVISRAGARGELGEVRELLKQGFRQTLFLVAPAMTGLIALREPVLRLLFARGEFGERATVLSADALFYVCLGLLSFSWIKTAVQGFYAVQDTRTPVFAATVSMALNIVVNLFLVRPMGYLGLALSTTISFTVNFLILYFLLHRRYGSLVDGKMLRQFVGIFLAAVVSAGFALITLMSMESFVGISGTLRQGIAVFAAMGVAALAYGGLCAWLQVPEMSHLPQLFHRR